MVYTWMVNPGSVTEFLFQKGGSKTQAENIGFGFFESIKEVIVKENQIQVANKENCGLVDFLKPETEQYKEIKTEEETPEELVSRIQELLKKFKSA